MRRIVIHAGHADAEQALRRQQEEMSFPVPFDWLRAKIEFVQLEPGEGWRSMALRVETMLQHHSHESYGYRFTDRAGGRSSTAPTASTRSTRWRPRRPSSHFFRDADLVICDTMYSLADSVR